ncbi:hypothetical protein A8709_27775 [Paenibacillus pectinilyticus]|uniref:Uncharacterized protein n=1 Tax=Paenibacillus pectinilyticus TaxID=512399 RepID=A0A1C0ZUC8_9BACL|nr:hypothetical protein [Paenibacillus pectinilyticus]OCT11677.1 hypothetical protein A8709_27775 [Paenibacillus pectinilyticus]
MRASSKWTKWQIGLVSAMIVVYLFQEVKQSPEFLSAVREASTTKENVTASVTPQITDSRSSERQFDRNSSDRMDRRGSSRERLYPSGDASGTLNQNQNQNSTQNQTQNQTQTHTRSHAS